MLGSLVNIHDSIINLSPSYGSRMQSELRGNLSSGGKEAVYLVTNDLKVKLFDTVSLIITLLKEFHVAFGDLEMEVVDMGRDEVYIYIYKSVLSSLSVYAYDALLLLQLMLFVLRVSDFLMLKNY